MSFMPLARRRMNVLVVWWVAKQTEATPEDELSRADMVKVRKWGELLCTEGSATKFETKRPAAIKTPYIGGSRQAKR